MKNKIVVIWLVLALAVSVFITWKSMSYATKQDNYILRFQMYEMARHHKEHPECEACWKWSKGDWALIMGRKESHD